MALVQRRRGPRVVLLAAKPGQLTSGLKGGIKRIRKTYRRRKLNETIQLQHDVCGQVIFPIDRQLFDLNFFSVISLSKLAVKHFLERNEGHVVVTSSIAGVMGVPFSASYSGSKFALHVSYFKELFRLISL